MMSENAEQPRGPAIEDVVRYFDGDMQPKEVLAFERQADESEEFAQQVQAMWEILEALDTAGERVDRHAVEKRIERVVADERQLWWRERLHEALGSLLGRSVQVAEGAEAAFEVTLRVTGEVASTIVQAAEGCLRSGVQFEFGYAAIERGATSDYGAPEDVSTGFFRAGEFSGVIRSDASHREVVITFLDASPKDVFLVPEDASAPALEAAWEPSTGGLGSQAVFRGVRAGAHLIIIPTSQ